MVAPIDWAKCGTEANYRRHLRLNEKPCEACLRAACELSKARKAKRKRRVNA